MVFSIEGSTYIGVHRYNQPDGLDRFGCIYQDNDSVWRFMLVSAATTEEIHEVSRMMSIIQNKTIDGKNY